MYIEFEDELPTVTLKDEYNSINFTHLNKLVLYFDRKLFNPEYYKLFQFAQAKRKDGNLILPKDILITLKEFLCI